MTIASWAVRCIFAGLGSVFCSAWFSIALRSAVLLPKVGGVKSHCIPALGMMYYSLESSLRDLQVMSEHDPEHEHDHEPSVYTWAQALQDSIVRSLPSKSSERVFSCLNGVAG